MVNREKQLHLSSVNNKSKLLYVQDVRAGVKSNYELADEVAMLRKVCYAFIHGERLSDDTLAEFEAYYNAVEQTKSNLKEELNI